MNSETQLTKPAYHFTIKSPNYFRPSKEFINLKIETNDSTSLDHKALLTFQELVAFHSEQKHINALVDVEIARLQFVYDNNAHELKDSFYVTALKELELLFPNDTISARTGFKIAHHYFNNKNSNWQHKEELKWMRKMAFDKCNEVIEKFPNTMGANNCQALKEKILTKSLELKVEEINVPGKPFRGLLSYQNLEEVWVRIVSIAKSDRFRIQQMDYDKRTSFLIKQEPEKSWLIELPKDEDFNPHHVEIRLPELEKGFYYILVSSSKDFDYIDDAIASSSFFVSNLSYIERRSNQGFVEFYVMDRTSGHPIRGVDIQTYVDHYDYSLRRSTERKGDKFKSDKEGYFMLRAGKDYRNLRIELAHDDDWLSINDKFYVSQRHDSKARKQTRTFFFLDRAIYRPGQTLHFKGLILNTEGESNELNVGYSTVIELMDANYQKVSEIQVATNEFGSFHGTFVLPTGGLNGRFHLKEKNGNKTFRVEDYKRPKFEVKFEPTTGSFRLNDSVTTVGKAIAYAGSNVDRAKVQYRVTREAIFPFYGWFSRSYYPVNSTVMEIAYGITETDENGNFQINFKAIPNQRVPKEQSPVFTYTVYADITDINGETQSSRTSVSVGYVAINAQVEIDEIIDTDIAQELKISTKNLNGEFEPAQGTIKISKLQAHDRLLRTRYWGQPDKFLIEKEDYVNLFPMDVYKDESNPARWDKGKIVFESGFDTEKEKTIVLKNLKSWEAGKYMVELETQDKFGEAISSKKLVTVYNPRSKNVPVPELDWYRSLKTDGEPGETAKFQIGSSAKNVKVLYEIFFKNAIVCKQWFTISNGVKTVEIPIEEAWRGNFAVNFSFVKHGRAFNYNSVVTVPHSDKMLNIELETFRDKLQPGQKEEWQLKISGSGGEKVASEMLAGMYDVSLDAFVANSWNLNLYGNYYYHQTAWTNYRTFRMTNSQLFSKEWNKQYYEFKSPDYDRLNWFDFNFLGAYGWGGRHHYRNDNGAYITMKAEADFAPNAVEEAVVVESADGISANQARTKTSLNEVQDNEQQSNVNGGKQDDLTSISPRKNLNETAFFFPELKTDAEGKIILSFTTPEALTRWKFMGFAHTKDLKLGFINKETVTQKELMVMPNPPRFFRENDDITFTAKISNISDKDLKGTAQLLLFDAITMQPVDEQFNHQVGPQSFTVPAGQSAPLKWNLTIPEGLGAVVYRVVASAANFTDGEENALPILTNRMLITESMPLNVRSGQTKTFHFDKLANSEESSTLSHHKVTLEFTSNPAWYAIQALPYLMEYPYECSEQTFNRFYANSIASNIANSNPKIKRVFDSWRNADVLVSNLEKNQELKSLLLEETPWVLDAQNETERKKRVAMLFDLNKMSHEQQNSLRKLIQAQTPNGGLALV